MQNRVALAAPQLPDAVTRLGVNVRAQQPNFLMIVNIFSPKATHDGLFLSNYSQINVRRIRSRACRASARPRLMGGLDYSMRIWLDPQPHGRARHHRRRCHQCDPAAERPGRPPA